MKSSGFYRSMARGAVRIAAGVMAALTMATTGHAQQSLGAFEFDAKTGTKSVGRMVFDPPAPTGYTPVILEISNGTDRDRTWRPHFSSASGFRQTSACESSFDVEVKAGTSNTVTLNVPVILAPASSRWGGSGNGSLRWVIGSAGFPSHENSFHWNWEDDFPAVAISEALAAKNLTALGDEVKKTSGRGYGAAFFGSRFAPGDLPEDWLGYTGFDALMISDVEWQKLSAGARTAVAHWVHLGGVLRVYTSGAGVKMASLGLAGVEPTAGESAKLGMGEVILSVWNGADLSIDTTVSWAKGLSRRLTLLEHEYARSSNWRLPNELRDYAGGSWQVIVFLILFGIVIGPVNLFVLAPAGRRYKLFFTTPLISLGAGILLVGLILLQDGTGGRGLRTVLVELAPSEATGYVTQEQFSRTGVLLKSGFTPEPAALVQPVALSSTHYTKIDDSSNSQGVNTTVNGRAINGNWFQSRAEQAQHAVTVVPTRSRIEFGPQTADGRPTVVSSLDAEVTAFVWRDRNDALWQAEAPLRKGERVGLSRVDKTRVDSTASAHWDQAQREISVPSYLRLEPWRSRRESFLARAASAPGFAVETLSSIKWERTDAFFYGSLPAQP